MKYQGLWRGVVVNNDDSSTELPFLGRIQVSIPEVYGTPDDPEALPWAWPCNTLGGGLFNTVGQVSENKGQESDTMIASGLVAIPAVGSTVWLAFEHGDPQVPVYLGTWNGRSAEMPSAAKLAGNTAYPNVCVLKMPWGKDIYVRFVEDQMLEISFGSMKLQMIAETSSGAGDGQMKLLADSENIVVQSNTGDILLSGATVTIAGQTAATLKAGTYKLDSNGKPVVDVAGDVSIQASQNTQIFTEKTAKLQAGVQGAIHAQAPTTSGFEKHTPVTVKQG